MNFKLLVPIVPVAVVLGSCTPYQEPWPRPHSTVPAPGGQTLNDADQQAIREQRQRAEEAARQANNPTGSITNPGSNPTGAGTTGNQPGQTNQGAQPATSQTGSTTQPGGTGTTNPAGSGTTPATPPKKPEYPYATKVPGKDGFVLSPYNTKVIDVRDIPSGTLVQDPNYPASEKKYFRVP